MDREIEELRGLKNPLPEYIEQLTEQLMETHHVVSIADLEHNRRFLEKFVDDTANKLEVEIK